MKKISEKKPMSTKRQITLVIIILCSIIGIPLIIWGAYAIYKQWYAFMGLLGLGVVFVLLAVIGIIYYKRKK